MNSTQPRAGRQARLFAWRAARRPRRTAARAMAAALGALLAGGLAIPAASADYDGLVYDGCIGGAAGCTAVSPADALNDLVSVYAHGSDVYSASNEPGFGFRLGAITHFTTDSAGNLSFDGCIGTQAGCTSLSTPFAPTSIAANGGQLYAASEADAGAVFHFTVDRAGNLSYAGCYGDARGCTPAVRGALLAASAVALTPDGRHLYVGSAGAVSHFTIDTAGNLTFAGCIGPATGCTSLPGATVDYASSLVVTPDGRQLYEASSSGNVVSHFIIDQAGQLGFAGCIGDATGCTPISPIHAIDGPQALAVTPDGANLYAAADLGNAVSHFTIDQAGNLIFAGCIGDQAGCTGTYPAGALDGATALAMDNFDGQSLYAAADLGNAITHFGVTRSGDLVFDGCIGDLPRCTPTGPALDHADGVAINNAGTHLYASGLGTQASQFIGSVSHFIIAGF